MVDKKIVGGISLLIVLLAGGGLLAFSQEDIDNTYVCPLNNMTITYADRFSSSMKTAYLGNDSYACRIGRTYAEWINLTGYLESQGIDIKEFTQEEYVKDPSKEICIFMRGDCYLGEA